MSRLAPKAKTTPVAEAAAPAATPTAEAANTPAASAPAATDGKTPKPVKAVAFIMGGIRVLARNNTEVTQDFRARPDSFVERNDDGTVRYATVTVQNKAKLLPVPAKDAAGNLVMTPSQANNVVEAEESLGDAPDSRFVWVHSTFGPMFRPEDKDARLPNLMTVFAMGVKAGRISDVPKDSTDEQIKAAWIAVTEANKSTSKDDGKLLYVRPSTRGFVLAVREDADAAKSARPNTRKASGPGADAVLGKLGL